MFTDEFRKSVAKYKWINTQHLWHLVRTNPGLTQFDTHKRRLVGLYRVLADYAYSTLRMLKNLKVLDEWDSNTSLHVTNAEVLDELFGPRLESFRVSNLPASLYDFPQPHYDPTTNQFLVTHPNPREFDSIMNFIKVDEMLRQPWACMGLERLTCQIVRVDRLNKEEEPVVAKVMSPGYSSEMTEEETRAVEKFHRCRAQHHEVCDQLASLTRLKHLDLGYENRNPWEYKGGSWHTREDGVQ
ncbi:hypothetical protein BGX24_000758 [Mortierella sp. AD032]|nr:hypothetical protein BGX24_000758 [Mortierella sp. AD032]